MTALITFDFEGSAVRSLTDETGAPWWVGKDVCGCLGHINHRDALARLDDDEKDCVGIADAIGRDRETTVINEAGVYHLIFTSRTEAAVRFKRWLAHEVLPSLRATGRYEMEEGSDEADPDGMALLDPDQERMWQGRILLYHRIWGRRGAQWAFKNSPLPPPPMHVRHNIDTSANPAADFVEECLESDPSGPGLPFMRIWHAYEAWCRDQSVAPVSQTMLALSLKRMGIRKRRSGRSIYIGIALKSPEA